MARNSTTRNATTAALAEARTAAAAQPAPTALALAQATAQADAAAATWQAALTALEMQVAENLLASLAAEPAPATVVAAPATAKPATGYVAAVLAALQAGPLTVKALAARVGTTEAGVRNAIDNVRRARGKDAIKAYGGGVFGYPT